MNWPPSPGPIGVVLAIIGVVLSVLLIVGVLPASVVAWLLLLAFVSRLL